MDSTVIDKEFLTMDIMYLKETVGMESVCHTMLLFGAIARPDWI